MKFTLTASLLFFASFLYSQDLNLIRADFHHTVKHEDKSKDFRESLLEFPPDHPTICAYKAASEALMARVLWNPFSKLNKVKLYDEMMDMAVMKDPNNLEIRFLRLSVEYNLPSFLGMSDHIQTDKQFILDHASQIADLDVDKSFSDYIFYFVESTNLCTEEEIEKVKAHFGM